MYQINNFYNKISKLELPLIIPELIEPNKNIFTILVGKNGMGKSTLLGEIAKSSKLPQNHGSKVIAISTSPFEKFPQENLKQRISSDKIREKSPSNYKYIGMSGNLNSNTSISLISSAMKGLFEQIIHNNNLNKIIEVFKMLEFMPILEFSFQPLFKTRVYSKHEKKVIKDTPLSYELQNIEDRYNIEFDAKAYIYFSDLYDDEVSRVLYSLTLLLEDYYGYNKKKMITFGINFQRNEIFTPHDSIDRYFSLQTLDALNILLEHNLVRLMDVRYEKIGLEQMSLRKASSGEQCLTALMLGISGHITDGSLVLIDEPEISLHPMWQKEFMTLLIKTFSHYENCHFIIATHSPQIIANLKKENCFVSSLTDNAVYPAEYFCEKSSDFQLAELFGAPGFKNEYLSRLLINIFAKFSEYKKFDDEDIKYLKLIENIIDRIDESDPVYELYMTLNRFKEEKHA